jgi:predicted nucleotidyltransferase
MNRRSSKASAKVFTAHQVSFAYLFGSRALGKARPGSDRDIAVRFRSHTSKSRRFDLRLKLWNRLSDVWPRETIDLIDLDEAPLLLQFRAIQPGKLLFSQNELERVRFEASTMSQYFDRKYYIDRGEAMRRKAHAGGWFPKPSGSWLHQE